MFALTLTSRNGFKDDNLVKVAEEFGYFGDVMLVDGIEISFADSGVVFDRISQINDRSNLQIHKFLMGRAMSWLSDNTYVCMKDPGQDNNLAAWPPNHTISGGIQVRTRTDKPRTHTSLSVVTYLLYVH